MRVRLGLTALVLASCRDGATPTPQPITVPPASASVASDASATFSISKAGTSDASTAAGTCAFVAKPPRTVGELLEALHVAPDRVWGSATASGMGHLSASSPSGGIQQLSVRYHWDPYHQDKVASADKILPKQLEGYTVRFADDRSACARLLGARWGAPVTKQAPSDGAAPHTLDQYGPFFLDVADGTAFTLEYHVAPPDWAVPTVDANERKKALRALAASITNASTDADVKTAVDAIPGDVGLRATGSLNPHDQWIRLEPPMAALELATALGQPKVIAQSVGVHMSSWRLVTVIGTTTATPRLGPWDIEATLTARPTGPKAPLFSAGPIAHLQLGATDVVRSLRIFPHAP